MGDVVLTNVICNRTWSNCSDIRIGTVLDSHPRISSPQNRYSLDYKGGINSDSCKCVTLGKTFSSKVTTFPLVFQLLSLRMSANCVHAFWSGIGTSLQTNTIFSTRNWKKSANLTKNKWPLDNYYYRSGLAFTSFLLCSPLLLSWVLNIRKTCWTHMLWENNEWRE